MDKGSNSNSWGTVTNTNLGTTLEQAIVGRADITMSSTTITLSLTDSNAAQDARAIYLNLTGSPGGAAELRVPAVQKPYIVKNGSDQQVTVKVAGLTGVVVPVGKTVLVYNNGTDVVTAVDYIPSLTLGAALPVASGGTGATTSTGSGSVVLAVNPTIDRATFTGNAQTTPVAVSFSATAMTVDCTESNVFTTTFTANVTVAPTISNPQDGQTINWFITQDGTGGRTMTWPTSFKWPLDASTVLSISANAVDLVTATYRSATGFWYATLLKGFA